MPGNRNIETGINADKVGKCTIFQEVLHWYTIATTYSFAPDFMKCEL